MTPRYNRTARTLHRYADVLAAVREYTGARAGQGTFTMSRVILDVGRVLNGTARWDDPTSWQVRRALNALSAGPDAPLVKVPRGTYGPDGRRALHTAIFWEPAAWDAALAEFGTWQADKTAVREAWERVYDIVTRSGITPVSERGRPVQVPLSGWAALLGLDLAEMPDDRTAERMARGRP
jgi:hypothetical protein